MPAVCFDHVSKEFMLHLERPRSFQELFLNLVRLKPMRARERYWALRDVSFQIRPGETVGLVGDNGAGKSTALKLMTRIIEPTSGDIAVKGRLSALLELAAGFHPDLTGRENIYLNGSILGFNKSKVDRIFDEIVAFSELERFIDVPVKHYSSGMYMRLGFSIAVHVEPEILLVDEVLAVGDQAFQLRCLDRISAMQRQGVTIILVSHNLESVRELCDRAIWLEDGVIRGDGEVSYVLDQYMLQVRAEDQDALHRAEAGHEDDASWRWGSREGEILDVEFLNALGQEQRSFRTGEAFTVRIHFRARERIDRPQFGLGIHHVGGFHINGPNTVFSGLDIASVEGEGHIDYVVDSLPLLEGTYLVSVSLYDHEGLDAYDYHHQAYTFRVHVNEALQERYGSFYIPATWRPGTTGFIMGARDPENRS
jgi:lipopolysaccharide transport system ATP-binding protein